MQLRCSSRDGHTDGVCLLEAPAQLLVEQEAAELSCAGALQELNKDFAGLALHAQVHSPVNPLKTSRMTASRISLPGAEPLQQNS